MWRPITAASAKAFRNLCFTQSASYQSALPEGSLERPNYTCPASFVASAQVAASSSSPGLNYLYLENLQRCSSTQVPTSTRTQTESPHNSQEQLSHQTR